MLSRSQAKTFFLGGTILATVAFIGLTVDSFMKMPALTYSAKLDSAVVHGKKLWDESNCMGCHTLLGEGGYYAPELTRVYERRGPAFIRAILADPEAMYPGERRMVQYGFTVDQIEALIAFFKWIGEMNLNGYPPKPILFPVATPGTDGLAQQANRPKVFNQMCIACHALGGQGGAVGPALDGVGDRMTMSQIEIWLENPQQVRPKTAMPDLPLTPEDIKELAAYLSTLRGGPGPVGDPGPGSPPRPILGAGVPPLAPGAPIPGQEAPR